MSKPTLVILAAGMGSRYGGLKQLDSFTPEGDTIIDFSIYDALRAGFGRFVFIIRKSFDKEFKEIFNKNSKGKLMLNMYIKKLKIFQKNISILKEQNLGEPDMLF